MSVRLCDKTAAAACIAIGARVLSVTVVAVAAAVAALMRVVPTVALQHEVRSAFLLRAGVARVVGYSDDDARLSASNATPCGTASATRIARESSGPASHTSIGVRR